MNSRRAAFTLAATAGGFLAAAFLPMATASADDHDWHYWLYQPYDLPHSGSTDIFGFAPVGDEDVFETSGFGPLFHEVQGAQEFVIPALHGDDDDIRGGFGADVTSTSTLFSNSTQIVVERDFQDGYQMPIGSEFDETRYLGGIESIHMNVPSGPDAGTADFLITPLGDFTLSADSPLDVDPFFQF